MAEPSTTSSLLRRALVWVAVGCAVALIARELRRREPGVPPAPAGTQAASVKDETLADVVPELVSALESRDTRFVMEHVSTSFKEERGLDYYDVRALVETAAFAESPLAVRIEQLELTPAGDGTERATARLSFARGQRLAKGDPLPEDAVTYAVELLFKKEGPRWLALTGTYRRESPPLATTPATPSTATR